MSETNEVRVSPDILSYPDDDEKNLIIEVELPGVPKESISFKLQEDAFYIEAKKEGLQYVGSYAVCCSVKPKKAVAKYDNGLLKVTVPFKEPFEDAIEVKIE